jgi:hypothetical protein
VEHSSCDGSSAGSAWGRSWSNWLLRAIWRGFMPTRMRTASGTLQSSQLHDLLDNPFRLWSIGGSVLAPLLNREAPVARNPPRLGNVALLRLQLCQLLLAARDGIQRVIHLGKGVAPAEQPATRSAG